MKKLTMPCMDVKLIPTDKVISNEYNPNKVASPEMKLLIQSIEEDGVTMPCVVYYDKENDIYIVIDGFHRYTVLKDHFKSDVIPCSIIDKDLSNRMASTIRHNRARGTHQIKDMSKIVLELVKDNWDDERISKHLGMELDEIIRLKQITGLKEAFSNHVFSKSWEEYENEKNKIRKEV
jgi:ParB-like chromosome segregation protein Spo0J